MSQFLSYISLNFLFCCIVSTCAFVEAEDQQNNNCSEINLIGDGSKEISLDNSCDLYAYTIKAKELSSIVKITITATPSQNSSEEFFESTGYVTINLQEKSKTNYKILTTVSSWMLFSNESFNNSIVSESFFMHIIITVEGNWSRNQVILTYEEIPFVTIEKDISESGVQGVKPWLSIDGRSYRPNCVYILRIRKPENMTSSNVMINVLYLDIDPVGEYLLIGAGSYPFEGPPPLFINKINASNEYFINDENAYIVFVAGTARKDYKGFLITWKHTGKYITVPDIVGNKDMIEWTLICIHNTTTALMEFNKTQDGFEDFKNDLAAVASEYAKEKNIFQTDGNNYISPSSVSIYQMSGIISINKSTEVIYTMVKISKDSKEDKAVFKRYQLEEIIDKYINQSAHTGADIYQFRKCQKRKVPESWSTLLLYLIIPVICCLFLLVWTWKHNPVSEYFSKRRRIKRASQMGMNKIVQQDECTTTVKSNSQNPYRSLPKLQVTNDEGRRYTLNLSEILQSDGEQSEDEIFNKSHHRRKSDFLESQRNKRTKEMFTNKQQEINLAFELEEEEKIEHEYDTLKSTNHLVEDEVTETKL